MGRIATLLIRGERLAQEWAGLRYLRTDSRVRFRESVHIHVDEHVFSQPVYPRSPGMGCTVRPAAVRN